MGRATRNYIRHLILYALLWRATGMDMAFHVMMPRNMCPVGSPYAEARLPSSSTQCNALQGEYANYACYVHICIVDKVLHGGFYLSKKGQCGNNMITSTLGLHMHGGDCIKMGYSSSPNGWANCGKLEFCRAGTEKMDASLLVAISKWHSCPGNSKISYIIIETRFQDCIAVGGAHNNNPDTDGWVDCHFNFCLLEGFGHIWGPDEYTEGSAMATVTRNAALMGVTSETVSMSSCTLCVMKCWYHRDCLSVNCGKEGSMEEYQCQLNTENKFYAPETSIVSHSYLSHYDIIYDGKMP